MWEIVFYGRGLKSTIIFCSNFLFIVIIIIIIIF